MTFYLFLENGAYEFGRMRGIRYAWGRAKTPHAVKVHVIKEWV